MLTFEKENVTIFLVRMKNILLMFALISTGLQIQVFEFLNNQNNEISQLSMKESIGMDQAMMICSSHKQMQVHNNYSSIFTLYEDLEMKNPWIFLGFWMKADLWINVKTFTYYLGGKVPYTTFRNWIHLCLKIDITKKTLTVSIDGKVTAEIGNVTVLSAIDRVHLGYTLI